ncbi:MULTISPECIES: CorA family divalent cation transporter [Flavobacteriaceae]|uniref:CorA family divalent cation transporter n=1 Tax=Maribacter flavus TaxID=1658664 RepID=A0ABU7IKX5_9FLAO|nr:MULTISPECIES: CorA family divalent cation transporter [Flavobacteriaceae]MDC6406331.1 CorA family divalent cation transporter [Maribacter sp. PR66]MEE1973451.1 CorA family divalent cation transporter [Maribacter flavus]NDV17717.1 hypothetical protein [Muricauda sp. TY007]
MNSEQYTATIREKRYQDFTWIDIQNPSNEEAQGIAATHGLNPILVKDSLQAGHLPKMEQMEDGYFMILRACTQEVDKPTSINDFSNKIAFFVTKGRLITIHRAEYAFLDSNLPDMGHMDALILYIIDKMVDSFQEPLENLSSKIDDIENLIFTKKGDNLTLEQLYFFKAKARIGKKLTVLIRSVIDALKVGEGHDPQLQDIKDSLTAQYLLYDEAVEDTNGLLASYLSVTAQKSNDVMKVLTIFSAFFLPLTFVAGIYGMNFDVMPELRWQNGYFYTLGFMILICLIVFLWFKRKRFL